MLPRRSETRPGDDRDGGGRDGSAGLAHSCAGLIAGTNDLRADLRLPLDASRDPISASLQLIVLGARAAGIAAFDGVFNSLEDWMGSSRKRKTAAGSASTARA